MPLVDPVTTTMTTSPVQSGASPTSKAKDGASIMHAIRIPSTPVAQGVRIAQPALLSGLFVLRFNALVEDPVYTLQTSLPFVTAIQAAYAFFCLPVAGSQTARKPKPGEKKRSDGRSSVITGLFLSLLLTFLLTPALHLAFVLFGAPFITHIPHTLLLSANLALLGLFPLLYVHGVETNKWIAIGGAMAPLDETFGGFAGALFGSWLGAVPIPLDWDREWQKWPVTILCGLYGGYMLGKLAGGTVFWGKRMAGRTAVATKEE